jgi:hypothetical protein
LATQPSRRRWCRGLDWRRDPVEEAAGEQRGAVARGLCERRPAGYGGCASGAGCDLRGKNRVAASGVLGGEARQATRREGARHNVGHWAAAGEGVC